MTPYELGQQAFRDFGQEAENPFDCEDDLSYVKWLQFEKGWDAEWALMRDNRKDKFVD